MIFWVSWSSSAWPSSSRRSISILASASVRPRMRALRKFDGLDQRRGRQADRDIEHAVFDLAVLGDQHDQRALGLEPHELDMLEPLVRFRRQHHAGGAAEPGEKAGRFGQHTLRPILT